MLVVVSIRQQGKGCPHIEPRPNIAANPILFFKGSCNPHNIGIGRITTNASINRFVMATMKWAKFIVPQEAPGTVLSQLKTIGRQRSTVTSRRVTK